MNAHVPSQMKEVLIQELKIQQSFNLFKLSCKLATTGNLFKQEAHGTQRSPELTVVS